MDSFNIYLFRTIRESNHLIGGKGAPSGKSALIEYWIHHRGMMEALYRTDFSVGRIEYTPLGNSKSGCSLGKVGRS